jgi:hypothetical protein
LELWIIKDGLLGIMHPERDVTEFVEGAANGVG